MAKPAVLYGTEVWGARALVAGNKKTLLAVQRHFLRAIIGWYSMTPTVVLMAVSGSTTCWMGAHVNWEFYNRHRREIEREKLWISIYPGLPMRTRIADMDIVANGEVMNVCIRMLAAGT